MWPGRYLALLQRRRSLTLDSDAQAKAAAATPRQRGGASFASGPNSFQRPADVSLHFPPLQRRLVLPTLQHSQIDCSNRARLLEGFGENNAVVVDIGTFDATEISKLADTAAKVCFLFCWR